MHNGSKEWRLKTKEMIGGRTGFIVAAPGRALPLVVRVRGPLARTRPSRTVRRQWRLWRLTHTLTQTHNDVHTTHTHTRTHAHTHTHTNTQTHNSRDTNASARNATHARQRLLFHIRRRLRVATVICCLVIIRPFVWCDRLVKVPRRNNSIVVSRSDFDRISLFCEYSDWYTYTSPWPTLSYYYGQLRVLCARIHFVLFV